MMTSSKTSSNCVTSCRFAPVTTSDNGTPRPSTNKCRLVPFFPPVGWVSTDCLLSQWRLNHSAVYALPSPGDTLHVIVFSKSGSPKRNKESGPRPTHKMGMNCARASKAFFGQCFPLAAGSQYIHNTLKYLSRWHRFSASTLFALIRLVLITLWRWYQGLNFFPKRIGYFP